MLLVGQKNSRTVPATMLHVVGHGLNTDVVNVGMNVEYVTSEVVVVGTVIVMIVVVGVTVV